MKNSRFDTVLAYANERANKIRTRMDAEYGKVKPFNTSLTPPVDVLYIYDKLMMPENADLRVKLIQSHGAEVFSGLEKKALRSRKARGL